MEVVKRFNRSHDDHFYTEEVEVVRDNPVEYTVVKFCHECGVKYNYLVREIVGEICDGTCATDQYDTCTCIPFEEVI